MDTAVIFGAGSVGRGFIGQLFSDSGLDVLFVDVNQEIIQGINTNHDYPQIIVTSQSKEIQMIGNVSAVDIADQDLIFDAISGASIIATAVGVNNLRHISPVLSKGLQKRFEAGLDPVNILLCENLHNAADYMKSQLKDNLDMKWRACFDQQVGLLETSIGRMIPVPTEGVKSIHPAAVMVEPYSFLPYDLKAVKGAMPQVEGLIGGTDVPFSFYGDRKLYIHNMGHCFCAYLGELFGDRYIHQSIQKPFVRYFVRGAMIESALALAIKYNQDASRIFDHVDDLLYRFENSGLLDTLDRVGRDPKRKMNPDDRFVGALLMAIQYDMPHRFLSLAVAVGLMRLMQSEKWDRETALSYLQSSICAANSTCQDVQHIMNILDTLEMNPDFLTLNKMLSEDLKSRQIV